MRCAARRRFHRIARQALHQCRFAASRLGHEQQVAAAWIDLERATERPQEVDPIARPEPGEPVRAASDDAEMERDERTAGRVCLALGRGEGL